MFNLKKPIIIETNCYNIPLIIKKYTQYYKHLKNKDIITIKYNNKGNIKQVYINVIFKVLENNLILKEIKEYVKDHLNKDYLKDLTLDAGYPK
ncbi:hypothetical protein MKX08_000894 [Trichoderma sp. CBMAI-0020]|nr:hypothetical protein MKX08_000894 [Trichoderma sp. CBMAI-0020]